MLKFADFLDRIDVTGDQSVEEAVLKIVNCPQGRQTIQQHWNRPSSDAEGPPCYLDVIKMNKKLILELEKFRISLRRIGELNQRLCENQSKSVMYREKCTSLDVMNRRLLSQLSKSRKCIEDMHNVYQEVDQERKTNITIAEQSLRSKELLNVELEEATRQIRELHQSSSIMDELRRQEKQQVIERLDEAMMKVHNLEEEMVSIDSKRKDCTLGVHQRDALLEQMVAKLGKSGESLCKQKSLLEKYRHSVNERSSHVEIAKGPQNPAQTQSTSLLDDFESRVAAKYIQRQREFLNSIVPTIQSLRENQTKIRSLTSSKIRTNLETQSLVTRQMAYITNSLKTLAPMRDRQSILTEKVSKCCKGLSELQHKKYPESNLEDDQQRCDQFEDLQLELEDAIYDRDCMEKSLDSMTKQRDYFQFAALESRNKYVLFISSISIRERRLMQTTAGIVEKYRTLQKFCKNRKFRSQRHYFILYQQVLRGSELIQVMKSIFKTHLKQKDEVIGRLKAVEEAKVQDIERASRTDAISSLTESRNFIKWEELLDGAVKRLQYDLEKLGELKSLGHSKNEKSQKLIRDLQSSIYHLQKLSEDHHAQNDVAKKRWAMASSVLTRLPHLSASLQNKNTIIKNLFTVDKLKSLLIFNSIQIFRSGMHRLKDQLVAVMKCKNQLKRRRDREVLGELRHYETYKNIFACARDANKLIVNYRSVIYSLRQKNERLAQNASSQNADLARSRSIVVSCKNQSVRTMTLIHSLRDLVKLKLNENQIAATRIDSQLKLIQELTQMHRNSSHCIESFNLLLVTLKSRNDNFAEFVDKLHSNLKRCEERIALFHKSWVTIATDLKQSHKDKTKEYYLHAHIELISGRFRKLGVLLSDISRRALGLKAENELLSSKSFVQSSARASLESRCSEDQIALKMAVHRLHLNHVGIREFVVKSKEMLKCLDDRNTKNIQFIKVTSLRMVNLFKIIGVVFSKTRSIRSLIEANTKVTGGHLSRVLDQVAEFLSVVRILIDRARKSYCRVFDLATLVKKFHLGAIHVREGVHTMCIQANRMRGILLHMHAQRQTDLVGFSEITHKAIEYERSFSNALFRMKKSYTALCQEKDIIEQNYALTTSLAERKDSESQRVSNLAKAFIIDSRICVGRTLFAASACGRDVHQLSAMLLDERRISANMQKVISTQGDAIVHLKSQLLSVLESRRRAGETFARLSKHTQVQRKQLDGIFIRSRELSSALEMQVNNAKSFSTAVVLSHNVMAKSANNFLESARSRLHGIKYLHSRKNAQLAVTFSKLRPLHDRSRNQRQKITDSTRKIIGIKVDECKKWSKSAKTLCQENFEGKRHYASYRRTLETANEHITEGQSLLKCNQLALQAIKGRVASLRSFFEKYQERNAKMTHELFEVKINHEKLLLHSGEITNELSSTEAELIQAYGFIRLKLEQDQLGLSASRTRPDATKVSLENELAWLRKFQDTPILASQNSIENFGDATLDTRPGSPVKEIQRRARRTPKRSNCYLIN